MSRRNYWLVKHDYKWSCKYRCYHNSAQGLTYHYQRNRYSRWQVHNAWSMYHVSSSMWNAGKHWYVYSSPDYCADRVWHQDNRYRHSSQDLRSKVVQNLFQQPVTYCTHRLWNVHWEELLYVSSLYWSFHWWDCHIRQREYHVLPLHFLCRL